MCSFHIFGTKHCRTFSTYSWKKKKNTDIYFIFPDVALSDPGSIKFSHIIEKCPRNWEITVYHNVALTVFHTQNSCHHAWKTLRIPL